MRLKPSVSWEGRAALVTGASSGIGEATTRALAARGVRLAISARRTDRLEALAAELAGRGAPRPVVLPADLGERGQAASLATAAIEALGRLDLLVNNAASYRLVPLVEHGDGDQAREMYETNVWAPLSLALTALPVLSQSPAGAIVNVCSAAAYMTPALHGIYASSKAATVALTDTLRLEIRDRGVTVLEVVVGPVDTPMLAQVKQAPFAALALRFLPPGTPAEMAERIVHAVEHRRRQVVYPWHVALPVMVPSFGKWTMRAVAARHG
ncbi:MAG TPA: SDR family NAD(P)-dependent oxidoreductase [Acidimicrobiia bacterium]|nr:SDR family NAD(P)-dependent oxidoreductase [Acidimicrobiia bacterium]